MRSETRPGPAATDSPGRLFFGWWIVGGTFVFYFVSGGIFNTATVFFKALATEFELTRGQLSGVFAVGFLVAGGAAPFWGRIADRRGPRTAFLPGTLLTGAACLALSRVWDLTSLCALYVAFTLRCTVSRSAVPLP